MEYIAAVADIGQADLFLYDIDLVDGSMTGELAQRVVEKHSNTGRQLRYNCHIWYAPQSALFAKLIVVHRVINSSEKLIF